MQILKFSFIDFCFPFFNQVCSIEKFKWGDHFHYKLGCAHQLVSKKCYHAEVYTYAHNKSPMKCILKKLDEALRSNNENLGNIPCMDHTSSSLSTIKRLLLTFRKDRKPKFHFKPEFSKKTKLMQRVL